VTKTATPTITSTPTATATTNPSGVELIVNGSFEQAQSANPNVPQSWQASMLTSNDRIVCNKPDKINAADGECAFRFKFEGDTNVTREIWQTVVNPQQVKAGDTLIFSIEAKAKDLTPDGVILLKVKYTDGTSEKIKFNLPAGTYGYDLFTETFVTTGNAATINVWLQMKGGNGTLLLDAVSLKLLTSSALTAVVAS
jgi:hypothetical protein